MWISDELSARSTWVAGLMLLLVPAAVTLLSIEFMGDVDGTAVRCRAGRG